MQAKQTGKKQHVKRWVAGGLCLLTLWRPLRAVGDSAQDVSAPPASFGEGFPPAPEDAAQELERTEAPSETTAKPEITDEPERVAEGTPPPERTVAPEATATPEGTVAPERTATPKGTAAPERTAAPGRTATPERTEPPETEGAAPQNALDDASFISGYALLLSGSEVRPYPHERKDSPALLRMKAGEVVLVTNRVAYLSTHEERRTQQTFDDWFALLVRDAEGVVVEGYLPGNTLMPMTAEEIKDMRRQWQRAARHAGGNATQLKDGIPQVSGIYMPPPPDAEETAVSVPAAPLDEAALREEPTDFEESPQTEKTPDANEIPSAEETLWQDQKDLPQEDPWQDEEIPSQEQIELPDDAPSVPLSEEIGLSPEPDETPAPEEDLWQDEEIPFGEEIQLPDDTPFAELSYAFSNALSFEEVISPEEDPLLLAGDPLPAEAFSNPTAPEPGPLARANALLAASPLFANQAAVQSAALAATTWYAPVIDDIQILYGYGGFPTVPYAELRVSVDVFGDPEVYAMAAGAAPGAERYCSYDATIGCYVLTLYTAGDYTVYVRDLSEPVGPDNPTSTPVYVAPQLTLSNAQDTQAPTPIGEPALLREVSLVAVSVQVEDALGAGPNETISGVTEVWLERQPPDGTRILLQPVLGTDEYEGEVYQNGTYYVFAKDRAGNQSKPQIRSFEIRDETPPVIKGYELDPPDDRNGLVPMVEVAAAVEEAEPSLGDNWVSGLATVEIGFFYGYEAQDIPKTVDLIEMIPDEDGRYMAYLEENGIYVIVATDYAGNRAFEYLTIEHIGVEKLRKRDPNWAFRPVDDDGDGLYTQTEYRLGIDPFRRDTGGDGLWDGLCVRLGLDVRSRNGQPTSSVLNVTQDASLLDPLVASGWLEAPVGEDYPGEYRYRVDKEWRAIQNNVVWMHPQGNTLLGINNRALFAAAIPRTEKVEIERAISLERLGYGFRNDKIFRTVEPCADGNLALLFERGKQDGPLLQDAYLIDTLHMQAYRIPDTRGALGLAISDDGAHVAVWRGGALELADLRSGKVLRIDDPERCARIEMLRFLPDNRLVTRVNSIGYSAMHVDGRYEVGDSAALPCLLQRQDLTGLTVYDRNKLSLRVDIQLLLRASGVFVQGEPSEADAIRCLSPRNLLERLARTEK